MSQYKNIDTYMYISLYNNYTKIVTRNKVMLTNF